MVGIGEMGMENMVARVSLVNQLGQCLYDKYVQPNEPVVDYRTAVSGVTEQHLQNGIWNSEFFPYSFFDWFSGIPLAVVQKEVSDIIENRLLVGHAIHNDLQVDYHFLIKSNSFSPLFPKGAISQPSQTTYSRYSTL